MLIIGAYLSFPLILIVGELDDPIAVGGTDVYISLLVCSSNPIQSLAGSREDGFIFDLYLDTDYVTQATYPFLSSPLLDLFHK